MKTLDVMCVTCPDCKGVGFIEDKLCAACDGAMQLVIPDRSSLRSGFRFLAQITIAVLAIILIAIAIAAL